MATQTTAPRVLEVGGGARFWAYISPQNDTANRVTSWEVQLSLGDWEGKITSENPQEILQTPGLSGIFDVVVYGAGPGFKWQQLPPSPEVTQPGKIGCNSNCAAMVGIVATPSGDGAQYWTVWDAFCDRS